MVHSGEGRVGETSVKGAGQVVCTALLGVEVSKAGAYDDFHPGNA